MRIDRLIIRKTYPNKEIIRELIFNKYGVNLIVDCNSDNKRSSGNSIGKSAVAKVIDLCFNGKSVKTLYSDEETKNIDNELKNYLDRNKVEAELIIDKNNDKISIIRQLFNRGKKIINGEQFNNEDFTKKLSEIVFNHKEENPTFRQLIPKFIRIASSVDEKVFKFLPFASNLNYDTIYIFLFNLQKNDLNSKKAQFESELMELNKIVDGFKKNTQLQSLDLLEQRKLLLEKSLLENKEKRENYNFLNDYKEKRNEFKIYQQREKELRTNIDNIEVEIEYINENINKVKDNKYDESKMYLLSLYNEAKSILGQTQKKFDDLVNFHNKMIDNKLKFLEEVKNEKKQVLDILKKDLDDLLEQCKNSIVQSFDESLIEDYNKINIKIEDETKSLGEVEKSINIWKEVINKIDVNKKMLEPLTNLNSDKIKNNLLIFNNMFSNITEQLYSEKYFISYDTDPKKFPINCNMNNGLGSGKKKGLIFAFDLAYYLFANEMNISCPKFIIHDKVETTDKKQLQVIFDFSNKIKAQLIVPILQEKIDYMTPEEKKNNILVELSTDDKFFRC